MRDSKQPLTAGFLQQLAKLKFKCEVRDHGAPGLGVNVGVSGTMSWILRYRRPGGKSAKLTLGPVDLDGARSRGRAKGRRAADVGRRASVGDRRPATRRAAGP
jgi:hypothetical protein